MVHFKKEDREILSGGSQKRKSTLLKDREKISRGGKRRGMTYRMSDFVPIRECSSVTLFLLHRAGTGTETYHFGWKCKER